MDLEESDIEGALSLDGQSAVTQGEDIRHDVDNHLIAAVNDLFRASPISSDTSAITSTVNSPMCSNGDCTRPNTGATTFQSKQAISNGLHTSSIVQLKEDEEKGILPSDQLPTEPRNEPKYHLRKRKRKMESLDRQSSQLLYAPSRLNGFK